MTAPSFLRSGLDEVHLPSGWVIRGRLPTVEDLYIQDLVPEDLLVVAAKFAQGLTVVTAPEAEKPLWHRFLRLLVANYVREVRVDNAEAVEAGDRWRWQPQPVSIDDTFAMEPRDIDELEYIVLRLKTAAQVSATWQADRGEITQADAEAIWAVEVARTLSGWATFRGLVAGAGAGKSSAEVRQQTFGDARPNRAARRARTRRSARRPAPDRGSESEPAAEVVGGDDLRDRERLRRRRRSDGDSDRSGAG